MLRSCLSVSAYTAVNGYPLNMDDMTFSLLTDYGFAYSSKGVLSEDGSYSFVSDTFKSYGNIKQVRFGSMNSNYIFPYDPINYDYYLVGTYAGKYDTEVDVTFLPIGMQCIYYEDDGSVNYNAFHDVKFYDYSNYNYSGHSFVGKFASNFNPSFGYLILYSNQAGTFSNSVLFSASVVPVAKNLSADEVNNAIIQELVNINANQAASNNLQQQSNQIAQDTQNQIIQGNEIAQDQLEVEQEQADTQKSLLERITDFFGSFFENLINAIIGLFVPGEEEMAELFNQLNDFFADKFGFLYYPFELLTKVFNVLMSESTTTAMTFPGITVLGYELCPAMEIDIAQNELVGDIFGHIRMITGGTMCFAFVNYLRTKFDKTVKS